MRSGQASHATPKHTVTLMCIPPDHVVSLQKIKRLHNLADIAHMSPSTVIGTATTIRHTGVSSSRPRRVYISTADERTPHRDHVVSTSLQQMKGLHIVSTTLRQMKGPRRVYISTADERTPRRMKGLHIVSTTLKIDERTPHRVYNSKTDERTPHRVYNSKTDERTPHRVYNSKADKRTPRRVYNSKTDERTPQVDCLLVPGYEITGKRNWGISPTAVSRLADIAHMSPSTVIRTASAISSHWGTSCKPVLSMC
ncbi:hypothetical protein J6590_021476 [Homalodisca vitripennis]|nr:hypothetical protein J6590_021476 [Homalodisca vitripennis]